MEWRKRIIEIEKEGLMEDRIRIDGAFVGRLKGEVDS
jgi:hypothetical protein